MASVNMLEGAPVGDSTAVRQLKANMNVIEIVLSEHRAVEQLWTEYQQATAGEIKEAKAHLIINQVVQHGGKEEIVLYPVMAEKLENGRALVEHSKQEHQQLIEDLYQLDKLNWATSPAEFDRTITKAITDLLHHVKEEESTLLPQLQAKCTQAELMALGQKFQSAIVTTRPHPMAPREGVAAAIANATSKPLDAVRDALRFNKAEQQNAVADKTGRMYAGETTTK